MSTLNLTPTIPSKVTGLTLTPAVGGATLKWDASSDITDKFEVWYGTTNSVGSASKLATVDTNQYTATNIAAGLNYYFWVRKLNKFGVAGYWSEPYLDGVNFNALKLGVYEFTGAGNVTASVDGLTANIWFTYANGAAGSISNVTFTTATTNSAYGTTNWSNVANARVVDGSYATVTTNNSKDILYTLSDLGIPSTATVTGMQFTVYGQTSNYTLDRLYAYFLDSNGFDPAASQSFSLYTTNNTPQTITVGNSSSKLGLNVSGIKLTQQSITSNNVSASTVVSSSTSAGTNFTLTSVSSYGTWYSQGYASWTAGTNEVICISESIVTSISAVSSTAGQRLDVYVRSRLYDVTAAADVPGGTKQYQIYTTDGTTIYGSNVAITNINENFISGFRGIVIPGRDYRLYVDVMKKQTTGTPTADVAINQFTVMSTSAATVS